MEHDHYLSYGQAYLFSNSMIGMVSVDELAENPVEQETETLGTKVFLWDRRRNSPSGDDYGSFGRMLEAYGIEETGDSEEDFHKLSLEAERRGERLYPIGIYEHSLVRYYLDSVTDRNQTIDGIAVLDKERLHSIPVPPEEYLKSLLETLTDWTNGEVYCVDMYTPRIVLDDGDVFVKLVRDWGEIDPIRELYAPKASDLEAYLPVGVGITELIGETFYSTDQLRNFIEEPENGIYREILEALPDKRQKEQDPVVETDGTAKDQAEKENTQNNADRETELLSDYASRLRRALSLPPAVSERLLAETISLISQDAEKYGWKEISEIAGRDTESSREAARSILLTIEGNDAEIRTGRGMEQEKEDQKRSREELDI